jgi:hypothetical protein
MQSAAEYLDAEELAPRISGARLLDIRDGQPNWRGDIL